MAQRGGASTKPAQSAKSARAARQGDLKDTLWKAADKLRGSMDAAEYKHFVLGLVFLRYVSEASGERRDEIRAELAAEDFGERQIERSLEEEDEYTGSGVFWVPSGARWDDVAGQAKNRAGEQTVGELLDGAMEAIEKAVYSGVPSDPEPISRHVRNDGRNKAIKRRMIDPDDEMELVIVASMWTTGFDSPPLHALYLDRPMRGAALMQAITRVNRPFGDKPAGLVIDHIGITEKLTDALAAYTAAGQQGRPVGADISEAVDIVIEQHGVVCGILGDYDWRGVLHSGRERAHLDAVLGVVDYLRDPVRAGNLRERGEPDLAKRFAHAFGVLRRAYAQCPADSRVQPYLGDIEFFDLVRVWMAKFDAEERSSRGLPNPPEVELALRQLAAGSVTAGEPMDVFAAAGIDKPDLSRLDEAFVQRMQGSTRPNLAIEALRRMLEKQIRATHPHNVVSQRTFSDRLLEAMRSYTNSALTSAEVISALVELANEVTADTDRARQLGLTEDELAFYDAVSTNESAVQELGENVLAKIARDLVRAVRADVTVDWAIREQVQAKLRSKVKRLLRWHNYPPDEEPRAVELVLEQTRTFAEEWSS